jgi:uncharacterized protein YcnI
MTNRSRGLVAASVLTLSLAAVPAAFGHANISPPLVKSGVSQVYTLAVPTEKEDVDTTKVELVVPDGFSVDSFEAEDGWDRQVKASGSGEDAKIQSVTWSGGKVPTEELAVFRFIARPSSAKTYAFTVRQTYSDGSVVEWSGNPDSDTPAPQVEASSSLGGGGSSNTLGIIGIVVGGIGVVLGGVALLTRGGTRSLT